MVVVTDFVENIVIIGNHEVSEQYFYQTEVLLFGAFVDIPVGPSEDMNPELKTLKVNYLILSDYR